MNESVLVIMMVLFHDVAVNLMEEEIEEDSRDGDNSESMNLKKRKKGTSS